MREPYFLWINKKPPVTAERKTISQGHLINICINITLLKKCLHCVALAKQWTCGDSNPGPLVCHTSTLPTELQALNNWILHQIPNFAIFVFFKKQTKNERLLIAWELFAVSKFRIDAWTNDTFVPLSRKKSIFKYGFKYGLTAR